jgi:hypothetical protein
MEAVRVKFDSDKKRWMALKNAPAQVKSSSTK